MLVHHVQGARTMLKKCIKVACEFTWFGSVMIRIASTGSLTGSAQLSDTMKRGSCVDGRWLPCWSFEMRWVPADPAAISY